MKRNLYLTLGVLLVFACCAPTDVPTPPVGGGGEDSTVVDRDTVNWGDSIVIPDSVDATAIDVVIDPADDTSYTEVAEEVITDEDHDDYGDFVETISGNVSVVYDGDVVTVTGNSGSVTTGGRPASVLPGVMAKVTGMHVEVSSTKKDIAFSLEGYSQDGSFKIMDSGDSNKRTWVILNGVSLVNPQGAAINIQSGKTIQVRLADGTTNYLEDGEEYVFNGEEQQKGAFFSEGQLVFSGNGSLSVVGHYKHGIASDDYVRIRNGHFTITSVGDGISTKDRFIMYGGTLDIDAGQDGVDVGEGYVEIGGGVLNIHAVDEALTASYEGDDEGNVDPFVTPYVEVKGGLLKLTTTGDKGHALRAMSTLTVSGGIVQATVKGAGSKALMSEGDMSLLGGKVTAFAEGDALYEAESADLSSAAVIRSKGDLLMQNMVVGAKSTGTGGKGINNVGDITMTNSVVTVVAIGENHRYGALDSHSRGVVTDGDLVLDGGALLIKSYDDPLRVAGEQHFTNDAKYEGYQIGE